jgi:hypothetical protein
LATRGSSSRRVSSRTGCQTSATKIKVAKDSAILGWSHMVPSHEKTLVLHHEDFLEHTTPPGHQESPGRIPSILGKLRTSDFANQLKFSDGFECATHAQLL